MLTTIAWFLAISTLITCFWQVKAVGYSYDLHAMKTTARCHSEFSWANTTSSDSPCLVAARFLGPCHGFNLTVPALSNRSDHYRTPGVKGTIEYCACSWASYNLLSACTSCQGFDRSILSWPAYNNSCGIIQFRSDDEFWHAEQPLIDGTTIPYWATTDPRTWNDQRFNALQAQQIAAQGNPDLRWPDFIERKEEKRPSKPRVGAIIAGVVGGMAGVVLISGFVFFMRSRKAKKRREIASSRHHYVDGPNRGRSMSDLSLTSTVGLASNIPESR